MSVTYSHKFILCQILVYFGHFGHFGHGGRGGHSGHGGHGGHGDTVDTVDTVDMVDMVDTLDTLDSLYTLACSCRLVLRCIIFYLELQKIWQNSISIDWARKDFYFVNNPPYCRAGHT